MTRGMKIGLAVAGSIAALACTAVILLFAGLFLLKPPQSARREISLPDHAALIIDGARVDRSEHGFSQRAGYRPPGSAQIEWFGDVSDGVEPQIYQSGPLLVVIDPPSACLFVRNPSRQGRWKTVALLFPNDLGNSPISFYAEKTSLTEEEVSRIDQLGGRREQKYPMTYIQTFEPVTRDLQCSYQLDNQSAWPVHFRLSEDGTKLVLVAIGSASP